MKKIIVLLFAFGIIAWWGSGAFFGSLQNAPETEDAPVIVSIATLADQPRAYSEQVVRVAGRVMGSASMWVRGYVLQDSTGHIIVTTDKAVPPRGQHIIVTGTPKQLVKVGQMQIFHLEEDHIEVQPSSEGL